MNGNILKYTEQQQTVIGVVTVITLSVILFVMLIIFTNPIFKICKHKHTNDNASEDQHNPSSCLSHISEHERSPYILPEPELFTSEPHLNQSFDSHNLKINKSNLSNLIINPVNKCINTINSKGNLRGKIQIVPKPELSALNESPNSWNFGERNGKLNDEFYH